jgi:NAD(P) transhydrogenase subunit alpha
MPLRIAVPKEMLEDERRSALVPAVAEKYNKLGASIIMERGAAIGSHLPDCEFDDIDFADKAADLYKQADIILKVQPPTEKEIRQMKEGTIVIGLMHPHSHSERVKLLRDRNITALAMELIPRISRAQSMDVLSSQASVAGYRAALMAAQLSSQFFPMLTTAAGTIRPAKVLVLGAGVAGLQAIATARRLGAVVEAYDVRSITKEQVESLGAKFIQLEVDAEADGGYARELTETEKHNERRMLSDHISQANAVITTANIPGRTAPTLIDTEMVDRMKPGSVIIDLAAETGGNCELTEAGKTISHKDILIHGPMNVPSSLAINASEMYAKNLYNLIELMFTDGEFTPDWDDEVIAGCTLTRDGKIMHEPTRTLVEGE